MKNPLTLDAVKKIVEGNIKTYLDPENDAWSQKIQLKDVDANGNIIDGALIEYKGLIGLRDLISQSILDVLTYATESGTLTAEAQTAGAVSVGTGASDKNNTKVHIEHSSDIEIKGANTDIDTGSGNVTIAGNIDMNSGNYTVDV